MLAGTACRWSLAVHGKAPLKVVRERLVLKTDHFPHFDLEPRQLPMPCGKSGLAEFFRTAVVPARDISEEPIENRLGSCCRSVPA